MFEASFFTERGSDVSRTGEVTMKVPFYRLRATIDELLHRVSQLKPSAESNSRNPEDIMSELKGLSRRARDTGKG